MSTKIFESLLAEADNEFASVAAEGISAGDILGYIDTGSYAFNAAVSGSIYGGIPSNKVLALAGEPSTGKTFYALGIAKAFLANNPEAMSFYFETESAISKEMLEARDVDVNRLAIVPVATVQQFRTQAVKILDKFSTIEDAPPMAFFLDSLGGLSTDKEVQDMTDGKDTRDMTRAQLIRGAFRVLTLKLGKANVPLVVTNHVYDVVGSYVPTKKMGGGSGLDYASSIIAFLSKKKNKDKNGKVTGAIITVKIQKGRTTVEGTTVETLLDYEKGLDRYYGLLDIAERFGIAIKVGNKYEFASNGTRGFESEIENNPEKFFTKDVLDLIDAQCQIKFKYGGKTTKSVIPDEVVETLERLEPKKKTK